VNSATAKEAKTVDIVLKAIRDLVAQIKLAVADASNISVSELERRLEGNEDRLVIAPAARKYADQLRVLWAWMTEEDGPEYWMARAWIHRFALTTVYANDPITDDDIEDDEEYRLRPGEVISFLLAHDCEFIEGPYPTDELNEQFFEAQRGGYSRDDFGINTEIYDDYDLRDPTEGWAEYLQPEGMAWVKSMIAWLERQPEPAVEWVFDLGVENYKGGDLNVVALALLVRELSVFGDSATLVAKTKKVPWYSHVDRSLIGNLYQFMEQFEGELDGIETDVPIEGGRVVWPWEEQRIADQWAAHIEKELVAHWTAQAKTRKPVVVENGQKIWAGTWTNAGDVAYNFAYFQAVANGFTRQEVQKAAEEARDRARKPKWVPNPFLVVSANDQGVVLTDNTFLRWNQAAKQVGQLTIQPGRKERLLDVMRRVYVRANGERPHIATVGKAIAAL
jgi:hypothetical protein